MDSVEQLSCCVKSLENQFERLTKRLSEIDTDGKLDEIKKSVTLVAANSQLIINTVKAHGSVIARLEDLLLRLEFQCPLIRSDLPASTLSCCKNR